MRRRTSIRRLLESYGAAALLVVVALRQIALAQTGGLSPWKGGGFGMFSSLNRTETRLLRCDLVTASSRTLIALPHSDRVSRLAREALSLPTRAHLEALAGEIAHHLPAGTEGGAGSKIHVEVRKLRFRSRDLRLFAELLGDAERPLP